MKESTQAAKEALEWYQEIAESALRYSAEKKGEALAAIIVNLSTDAGNRARKGIEALAGAKWASPSQKSKEEIIEGLNFHLNDPGRYELFSQVISPAMDEWHNQFTQPPSDNESDVFWNNVVARISAANLFGKVKPDDVKGIIDWKQKVINELKREYSICKITGEAESEVVPVRQEDSNQPPLTFSPVKGDEKNDY